MLKNYFRWLLLFILIFFPLSLNAETLHGIIRNINYGSHSFGLDLPPLTRVYVNAGTRYKNPAGNNFGAFKVGDEVKVEARTLNTGTYLATKMEATGHIGEVKDLASNNIKIKLDERFLMGVNQTADLKEGGKTRLELHSTEFINTLCKGYDCGDRGEIGMRLEVKKGGDKSEIVLLSKNHRKPSSPVKVELYGYTIQLVEAGEDVVVLVVRPAT